VRQAWPSHQHCEAVVFVATKGVGRTVRYSNANDANEHTCLTVVIWQEDTQG
jgi:hypothetical protein